MEFSVPLLTLLQLQSYLVACISSRIFIIPKLQNIYCRQFISELFSLCIEHLPNCSVRHSPSYPQVLNPVWSFREHLPYSLPTEMIFSQLRLISEEYVARYSAGLVVDMLEIITKWLQVCVTECKKKSQTQAKDLNYI